MSKTRQELVEIEAELDYWNELAEYTGWKLAGWNRRAYATFKTEDGKIRQRIHAPFRDSLVNVIRSAKGLD